MTGRATHFTNRLPRAAARALLIAILALCLPGRSPAESKDPPADSSAIKISADFSQEWSDSEGRVAILRGRCRIVQGAAVLQARQMVVWRTTQASGHGKRDRLTVYLEEDVLIEEPGSSLNESPALVVLSTGGGVNVSVSNQVALQAGRDDPLFLRADHRRRKSTARAIQAAAEVADNGRDGPDLRIEKFQLVPPQAKARRIRVRSRTGNEFYVESRRPPNRTPPEQVTIITGGVNIRIEGIEQRIGGKPIDTIDLSADRMVIWSRQEIVVAGGESVEQSQDEQFEIYMEGNIVIYQGDPTKPPELKREARASYATFDARDNKALLLNAELKTYIPSIKGTVRVMAERLQQLGPETFHAKHATVTTSPYGKPGYRVQSKDVFVEPRAKSTLLGAGPPPIDPATGEPTEETDKWITALNNTVFVDDVPVFYFPYLSAPADNSDGPFQNVLFSEDKIFGTQIRTMWDPFKLFGFKDPKGQTWSLLADYYSLRGPGGGLTGKYRGNNLFDIPGHYQGELIGYYVHDHGTDDLGADRRALVPATENRGRFEWRHLQSLPDGFTVNAEIGYASDRNFVEQFYQWEFDRGKDIETLVQLKQQRGDWAWTAVVQPEPNGFEYTTEWLPRGDLYALSEPLFDGRMTWSMHSSAGYGLIHQAQAPTDPNDVFVPIPYFPGVQGAVLMTRHQLDAPFSLGPVRLVPYVMGEAAYWGEGIDGTPLSRLVGTAGVRSTMEMFRAFPTVQSDMFNLNGLAHRVLFEAGYAWTESTQDLNNLAIYNEFDDNAQERFRERLILNTYGGVLPPTVDPRFYAVRTGAAYTVSTPYNELVDDQQVARFALRQRLQTKVGPPDHQRIRDWMTLDLEASYFPNPNRDDFGQRFGLLTARYAWNVSQRTSILADALYDLFPNAPQLWNVAVLSQRSERGSVYLGLRELRGGGKLDSEILTASYSYQMSPKWISTMGTAYDLAENRNAGQSFTITRVGVDFVISAAGNYDVSTGNVGFALTIEPRIGNFNNPMTQLSNLLAGQKR